MSTSITKQGIMLADGAEIGENLVLNSCPFDSSKWAGSGWNLTEKNGFKCIHFTGANGTTKTANPFYTTTNANNYKPAANEIISMSCDVLMENVVLGPTNAYVDLYGSGATIDGTWRGCNRLACSDHYISYNGWHNLDPAKLNGVGWVRVYKVYQYGNYTYPALVPNFYARDFTGDVYFKNFKVESSSKPTPWTPSPLDDMYTATNNGFFEGETKASVSEGYFAGREIYEA